MPNNSTEFDELIRIADYFCGVIASYDLYGRNKNDLMEKQIWGGYVTWGAVAVVGYVAKGILMNISTTYSHKYV